MSTETSAASHVLMLAARLVLGGTFVSLGWTKTGDPA